VHDGLLRVERSAGQLNLGTAAAAVAGLLVLLGSGDTDTMAQVLCCAVAGGL
jgi:hypothetical protein